MRKQIRKQVGRSFLGLFIAALGQCLTINACVGYFPWDVLHMGIVKQTHISYGTISMCISIMIIVVDLLLKEHIGIGSLMDGFFYGYMIDFWRFTGLIPKMDSLGAGVVMMLFGMAINSYGLYFYMSAGLSCGPRDALLLATGKRLRRIPFGFVDILIFALVTALGYCLGGMVGLGTLIAVFGNGLIMQGVFHVVHFEPRDIDHESVVQTWRRYMKNEAGTIQVD